MYYDEPKPEDNYFTQIRAGEAALRSQRFSDTEPLLCEFWTSRQREEGKLSA
jgi:hypothetical protein